MVWQQHIENYNLALVTRVTHNIGMSKEKVVLENEGLQREEVEEGYEEEAEEGKKVGWYEEKGLIKLHNQLRI